MRRVKIVDFDDSADGEGLDVTFEDVDTGDRYVTKNTTIQGLTESEEGDDNEAIFEMPTGAGAMRIRFTYDADPELLDWLNSAD